MDKRPIFEYKKIVPNKYIRTIYSCYFFDKDIIMKTQNVMKISTHIPEWIKILAIVGIILVFA